MGKKLLINNLQVCFCTETARYTTEWAKTVLSYYSPNVYTRPATRLDLLNIVWIKPATEEENFINNKLCEWRLDKIKRHLKKYYGNNTPALYMEV